MVVDSSIFIDHYRTKDKSSTVLTNLPKGTQLLTSPIVIYETYLGADTPEKRLVFDKFFVRFKILPLNREIAEIGGLIYQNLKSRGFTVGGNDILIAATCLFHNQPVKTSNRKDFLRIDGLTVL